MPNVFISFYILARELLCHCQLLECLDGKRLSVLPVQLPREGKKKYDRPAKRGSLKRHAAFRLLYVKVRLPRIKRRNAFILPFFVFVIIVEEMLWKFFFCSACRVLLSACGRLQRFCFVCFCWVVRFFFWRWSFFFVFIFTAADSVYHCSWACFLCLQ